MRAFKLVVTTTNTGPRLFVAIDNHFRPDILNENDENIIVTADAADMPELDGMIDELIDELNSLRADGKRKFAMIGAKGN